MSRGTSISIKVALAVIVLCVLGGAVALAPHSKTVKIPATALAVPNAGTGSNPATYQRQAVRFPRDPYTCATVTIPN